MEKLTARERRTRPLEFMPVLLVVMTPASMFAAREIPATILIVSTLMLAAAAIPDGTWRRSFLDLRRACRMPAGFSIIVMIAFVCLSIIWSPAPARGASHAIHFAGGILLGAFAATLAYRLAPQFAARVLALPMMLAALLLSVDLWLMGELRALVGLSADAYRLNRASVAIALLLPLATALLIARQRIALLGALWIVALIAIHLSWSNSAKLGILVVVLILPLALLIPNVMYRLAVVILPLLIMMMPLVAPIANEVLPQRVHEAVGHGSLTMRGLIWWETTPFILQKPFFGWGIEASHVLPHLPEAAHLTQVQRDLLSWGHTHNAPLQIWLELGAVGAALSAAALYFGIRALRALPPTLLPYATTTVIAAFAIACVSHGAWQAWWWALLGLIATAYAMAIAAHFPNALGRAGESGASPTA